MILIEQITVPAGGSASITFSSIPQTFTDLFLLVSPRANAGAGFSFDDLGLRLNADSAANYNNTILRVRDGAVGSFAGAGTSVTFFGATATSSTANTFGNGQAYFPNYANSQTKFVTCEGFTENNSTTGVQGGFVGGRWNNTAAITSIQVASLNGWGFGQNSSASLYGIIRGSSGSTTVS